MTQWLTWTKTYVAHGAASVLQVVHIPTECPTAGRIKHCKTDPLFKMPLDHNNNMLCGAKDLHVTDKAQVVLLVFQTSCDVTWRNSGRLKTSVCLCFERAIYNLTSWHYYAFHVQLVMNLHQNSYTLRLCPLQGFQCPLSLDGNMASQDSLDFLDEDESKFSKVDLFTPNLPKATPSQL